MSLKDTPLGTPEEFNVVVEIPKGSANKFEYDEAKDEIVSDFVFKDNFKFIFNYGFLPQTRGGDGDTLDAIILGENPIASGTIVLCRPIGVMKMLDRGVPDDKVLAVPVNNPDTEKYQSILDLSETERQQFRDFYAEVARQKEKIVEVLGFADQLQAIAEIKGLTI